MGCGPANDCKYLDADFAGAFRRLAGTYDYVIVAGDFFEMWEPGPGALPRTEDLFREICAAWPETMSVVNGARNIIILTGNHDSMLHLSGWLPKARTEVSIPELSLFVAHGHQGDRKWCSDDSFCLGFVKCLACCVGYGEMLIDPNLDEQLSRAKGEANKGIDCQLADYAFAVAARLGAKVVCFGHTHHAEIVQRGQKIYVNCGKCVGAADLVQFAAIESAEAGIRVSLNDLSVSTGVSQELESATVPRDAAAVVPEQKLRLAMRELEASGSSGVSATQYSRGVLIVTGPQIITKPASFLSGDH